MRLQRHLSLIQNILYSRHEIDLEYFRLQETHPKQKGIVEARLRFPDGSLLEFVEILETQGVLLVKVIYTYHFQDPDGQLIFRYDNALHHPEISTHPHHKHTPDGIVAATAPHLSDVLREIDRHLYPD